MWRKSVPGEPNIGGQVYVGDAVFLDGARPDLAALHPQMPFNTRAGWGIQVLTNMLPNAAGAGPRGNGQHQLFVYAFDAQGKSTLLGTPIINVNTATAVKPFGTIDRPENGETISGAGYLVWGWALTPQPGLIPFDASTIWVFIDGVPQGHPVYNLYRADVSTLFPGLNNSSGPVGYFQLDTTKLTNGMHSIAWSVTDNMGRVEGIGSRLFFVQNTGQAPASASSLKSAPVRSAAREGMWMRTGYDPDAQLTRVKGNDIEVAHGGRLELHVAGAASVEIDGNAGLPVGATLKNGVFYWQLDPAFLAAYTLKFRDTDGTEMNSVCVRVKQ